jgi:hypothetical protein
VSIVVLGVVGCAVLAWVAVWMSPRRSRRRQQLKEQRVLEQLRQREAAENALARQWIEAVAYSQRHSRWGWDGYGYTGIRLAHVTEVYGDYPRRGTKAVLRWYGGNGEPQDTWFELAWPRAGDWLLVGGRFGYGPHNDNPETFYAHILGVVPAGAWEAWQRQQRQLVAGQTGPA